jgi:hypothetical protein
LATHPSIRSFTIVEATDNSRFVKTNEFDFLDPKTPDRLSFPTNTLPNITHLLAPDYLTLSILASPTSSPRPLHKISVGLTDESLFHLRELSSLKDISVGTTTPEQLANLAVILPNVVTLHAAPVSPRNSINGAFFLAPEITQGHLNLRSIMHKSLTSSALCHIFGTLRS